MYVFFVANPPLAIAAGRVDAAILPRQHELNANAPDAAFVLDGVKLLLNIVRALSFPRNRHAAVDHLAIDVRIAAFADTVTPIEGIGITEQVADHLAPPRQKLQRAPSCSMAAPFLTVLVTGLVALRRIEAPKNDSLLVDTQDIRVNHMGRSADLVIGVGRRTHDEGSHHCASNGKSCKMSHRASDPIRGRNVMRVILFLAVLLAGMSQAAADMVQELRSGARKACRDCDLRQANFKKADLSGVDLTGADLTGARFHRAILRGTILKDVTAIDANFNVAQLREADLSGADLTAALFYEADLSGADLGKANLTGAKMQHVRATRAKLTNATLHTADLTKARLNSVDFTGAVLHNTVLREASVGRSNFKGADISYVTIVQSDLAKTSFAGSTITFTDFWGSDLRAADFSDASIQDSRFSRAQMTDAQIDGATIQRTFMADGRFQE